MALPRGAVELPLHMAWSGQSTYDLGKPRQRMSLYRSVLHEGLREDLPRYLDQDLLLELWPVLRTLVGRTVRTVWEDTFPQLGSRAQKAAGRTCRSRTRGSWQRRPPRWRYLPGTRLVDRPNQDHGVATGLGVDGGNADTPAEAGASRAVAGQGQAGAAALTLPGRSAVAGLGPGWGNSGWFVLRG
jgi:hypothetical protein